MLVPAVHTVVGFYPLPAEVDHSPCPVHVIVINRDENNVFREDIHLRDRNERAV